MAVSPESLIGLHLVDQINHEILEIRHGSVPSLYCTKGLLVVSFSEDDCSEHQKLIAPLMSRYDYQHLNRQRGAREVATHGP